MICGEFLLSNVVTFLYLEIKKKQNYSQISLSQISTPPGKLIAQRASHFPERGGYIPIPVPV